eukprot:m.257221 g.257221  ORF g.257221 m.257221 type:complete len:950 (-) comp20723_c0_seq1:72-2921(-)
MTGDSEAVVALCSAALGSGDARELLSTFQSLPPHMLAQAADLLRTQGSAAFGKKDYEEAGRCYAQALLALPADAKLLSNLAACHLALGRHEAACEAATRAVAAAPTWSKAHYRLGCALEALERKEDALRAYTEALSLEGGDATLRARVSALQGELAEKKMAARLLEQAGMSGESGAAGDSAAPDVTSMSASVEDLFRPEYSTERIRAAHEQFFARNRVAPANPADTTLRGLQSLLPRITAVHSPKRDLSFWSALLAANPAYVTAIETAAARLAGPSTTAIHVGTGLGVAPVLAIRAGITRAVSVESRPFHCSLLKAIAATNRVGDRIDVYSGQLDQITSMSLLAGPPAPPAAPSSLGDLQPSSSANLADATPAQPAPHKVDAVPPPVPAALLLVDLLEPGALGLRALPAVHHAFRAGLLDRSALVLPARIAITATLVENRTSTVEGFDMSGVNTFRWSPGYQAVQAAREASMTPLTDPIEVFAFTLDEHLQLTAVINARKAMRVKTAGIANAMLFWFSLDMLGDGQHIVSSGPLEKFPDCSQALQYLDDVPVKEGSHIDVFASHNSTRVWFDWPRDTPGLKLASHRSAVPLWQLESVGDRVRSAGYAGAVSRAVRDILKARPACRVLDVGGGTGLVAMAAMRAGASHVEACDGSKHVVAIGQETVRRNGFLRGRSDGKIHLQAADVRTLTVPAGQQYDVLVHELVDYGALGEGIIPLIRHCRAALLQPHARIIPARIALKALLVSITTPAFGGVDLAAWDRYRWAPNYAGIDMRFTPHVILSEEASLFDFSFDNLASLEARIAETTFVAIRAGIANAVLTYFQMDLDDEASISTAPSSTAQTHWLQAVRFIAPIAVTPGATLPAAVGHNGVDLAIDFGQPPETLSTAYDANWLSAHTATQQLVSKMLQAVAAPDAHHRTTDAALALACQPGLLGVDPHDAAAVAAMLCA